MGDSLNGTFLQSKKFLNYHQSKFLDQSIFIVDNEKIHGVFPAAVHPADPETILSHPGSTFGGLLFSESLRGSDFEMVYHSLIKFYRESGFKRLIIKNTPTIYHSKPVIDELRAQVVCGGRVSRIDLSSTIDLKSGPKLNELRKRSINKAKKADLTIHQGRELLQEYWPLLCENLTERHNVMPVHSLSEIQSLFDLFPEVMSCKIVRNKEKIVSGAVFFNHRNVCHAQYLSSNEEGRLISALDLLLWSEIQEATQRGLAFFDFGTSNERDGSVNDGLYSYKKSFGSGSWGHFTVEISL